MDDKMLLRLSVLIAAAGLVSLIAAAQYAEPKIVEVSAIDEHMIGQSVVVNGTVESVSLKDGTVFIEITDGTKSIDIVMFEQEAKNSKDAYTIKKPDMIAVAGKVSFYRNSLEIVADSITRI